jgi:hypothetical protein
MCNLYSITTNQAAIAALFRVMNRYVGNLPPMPRHDEKMDALDEEIKRMRAQRLRVERHQRKRD